MRGETLWRPPSSPVNSGDRGNRTPAPGRRCSMPPRAFQSSEVGSNASDLFVSPSGRCGQPVDGSPARIAISRTIGPFSATSNRPMHLGGSSPLSEPRLLAETALREDGLSRMCLAPFLAQRAAVPGPPVPWTVFRDFARLPDFPVFREVSTGWTTLASNSAILRPAAHSHRASSAMSAKLN